MYSFSNLGKCKQKKRNAAHSTAFQSNHNGYLCKQEEGSNRFPLHERTSITAYCSRRMGPDPATATPALQRTADRVDNLIISSAAFTIYTIAFPANTKQDCGHAAFKSCPDISSRLTHRNDAFL